MLNLESSKPLYAQIKDYLLYQINSGELEPHSRVPSERNLSQQFGVSRLTASKAIRELVTEGILYTQVGKGTFVCEEPVDQQLSTLTSFTEEMRKRGQQTSSLVLKAEIISATGDIARHLQIPTGVPVILLQRVRMVSNQPVAIETSHLVMTSCPDILDKHDFAQESLYSVLQTVYDLELTHAEQVMSARGATAEEAELFGIHANSPILNITRVTFQSDEHPIEYVTSAYRGDRYKFRAILRHL